MVPANPTSLEEAFDLVRQKPLEKAVQASSNPFDRFMMDLAKVVKEEKKTFVPRKVEVLVEEVEEEPFEEEFEQPEPIYVEEAMSNLTNALQKARIEAQYRLQEAAKQQELILEEELVAEKIEPAVPLLATSLEGVLTRLAEALQKNNQPEEELQQQEEPKPVTEPTAEKKPYVPSSKEENPYLKELIRSTKNQPKLPKGSKKKADIKKLIAEQVNQELEAFRRQLFSSNLMMGGGGGGTNAVQYAAGGTMNGDLNVTGRILSGGVDISDAIANMIINIQVPPPSLIDAGPY